MVGFLPVRATVIHVVLSSWTLIRGRFHEGNCDINLVRIAKPGIPIFRNAASNAASSASGVECGMDSGMNSAWILRVLFFSAAFSLEIDGANFHPRPGAKIK